MNPFGPIRQHFKERAHEARRATEKHGLETRRRGYLGAAFSMTAAGVFGAGAVLGVGVVATTVAFLPDITALPFALPLAFSLAGSAAVLGCLSVNFAADACGQWQAARHCRKNQPA